MLRVREDRVQDQKGRKRHVLNKNTSSQNLLSRDDLKHMMEEVVDKVISDGCRYEVEIEQQLKILPSTCCDNEVFVSDSEVVQRYGHQQ